MGVAFGVGLVDHVHPEFVTQIEEMGVVGIVGGADRIELELLHQFDVAAHRLKDEYGVDAMVEAIGVQAARWVECDDPKELKRFREKAHDNLAEDGDGQLVYLAPTRVNLNLTMERWPDVRFLETREL